MPNLIYPYKTASRSARSLRQTLGMRFMRNGPTVSLPTTSVVVNWGNPRNHVRLDGCRILNDPDSVSLAGDKLRSSELLQDICPSFGTTTEWVRSKQAEGHTVLARTLLRASGGRGIEKIFPDTIDIPAAPLYTEYVKKSSEWRVHVFQGEVIFIQRKIARPDTEPADWMIRNHDNGFIFQQEYNREAWKDELSDLALRAVDLLGLDFGAVDLIWNNHRSQGYVLEVNTAPGLEGRTLEVYSEKIRGVL